MIVRRSIHAGLPAVWLKPPFRISDDHAVALGRQGRLLGGKLGLPCGATLCFRERLGAGDRHRAPPPEVPASRGIVAG